ncbi:hypothetical protein [Bacillus safensis]|uniref:hypothetical protein n=1 Tax=Bacillus safensis TaxID=561879 RepID=UPI002E1F60F8|nr:hypothetical protein [Bacillus safensis]
MTNKIILDTLVEKSIGEKIKRELEISIRDMYRVVKKYSSILHDGDVLRTQNMIKNAFFSDKPLLNADDEIEVDMSVIINDIPLEKKEEVYLLIQEQLAVHVDVNKLMKNNNE